MENIGIPYCGGCSRKEKREGLNAGSYYCQVVAKTPMNGIVTIDTDGTKCVNEGNYIPIRKYND